MMTAAHGDALDPNIKQSYLERILKTNPNVPPIERIDGFAFYEWIKNAFAVVMSGETAKYGKILLKKGVIPVDKNSVLAS